MTFTYIYMCANETKYISILFVTSLVAESIALCDLCFNMDLIETVAFIPVLFSAALVQLEKYIPVYALIFSFLL